MAASLPLVSPPSDKRFWSTLRNRVDALLESRNSDRPSSVSPFVSPIPSLNFFGGFEIDSDNIF